MRISGMVKTVSRPEPLRKFRGLGGFAKTPPSNPRAFDWTVITPSGGNWASSVLICPGSPYYTRPAETLGPSEENKGPRDPQPLWERRFLLWRLSTFLELIAVVHSWYSRIVTKHDVPTRKNTISEKIPLDKNIAGNVIPSYDVKSNVFA